MSRRVPESQPPQIETSNRPVPQRTLTGEVADDVDIIRAMIAEFIGTVFLIFFGLGAVFASAVTTFDVVKAERLLMMSLAYGFSYGACLYGFSFPSLDERILPNTRHLNPAVTISLLIAKKISFPNAMFYLVSQVVGCGVGVLLIFFLTPLDKQDVVSVYPSVENTTKSQEWAMEIITSFIMILTVLFASFGHLSTRPQALVVSAGEEAPQTHHEINCLISGFIVVVCNALGSGISGGYMNPLFAMGITILSGVSRLSTFFGPFIGGTLAIAIGILFGFNAPFAMETSSSRGRYQRMPVQ